MICLNTHVYGYTHNMNELLNMKRILTQTCARTWVHTLALKCTLKLPRVSLKNNKMIPWVLIYNYHNLKTNSSHEKSFLSTTGEMLNAHVHTAHPASPDTDAGLHTCVRPVVVLHGGGREEWVMARGPGTLKWLFSRVELHVVVQGPLLSETSIT